METDPGRHCKACRPISGVVLDTRDRTESVADTWRDRSMASAGAVFRQNLTPE